MTSVTRPASTDTLPEATLPVPADNPSAPALLVIPFNPQSPRPVYNHLGERTVIDQRASPPPPLPLPHLPLPPAFLRVLSPPPRHSSPPSGPLSTRTLAASTRPLKLPELTTELSANLQCASSTADLSSTMQQPSVYHFEQGVKVGLATQQSFESFACGGLNGGAQEICVPGTQNSEHAAAPQQLGVRSNYEPMGHDQAIAVPSPQASLPMTAPPVETNPDNDTNT